MCTLVFVIGCSSGGAAGGRAVSAAPAAAPAQPQAAAPAVGPEAARPATGVAPLSAPTPKAASSGVVLPTGTAKVKKLVVSMAGPAEEANAATSLGGTTA